MSNKPVYILGTGLSHDGSSCLLKDGHIICAIEKERLSRKKHDGGNDALTVKYCLDYAGITVHDLSLMVQAANFEKDTIQKDRYQGARFFTADCAVPFVSISHHLAHAYSAVGTSPFDEGNVLVIDGCGSPYEQCDDLEGAELPQSIITGLYAEKDSFYRFSEDGLFPLYKDFSELNLSQQGGEYRMPLTTHSIGGLYSKISQYIFGNMDDAGKLMGLAPYGNCDRFKESFFLLKDGRVFVNEDSLLQLNRPAASYQDFKDRFNYFADVASWAQRDVEEAVVYIVKQRLASKYHPNLCYAGGVALNAVANARILRETPVKNLYMMPAAADNGLAIGCAYYGWLNVLKRKPCKHDGAICLGKVYTEDEIEADINRFIADHPGIMISFQKAANVLDDASRMLADGKVIGWFQGGAEFGPRALGNRSILADARSEGVRAFINRDIKFREDFRPFAPAVTGEDVSEYFKYGYESPYMILVDEIKENYRELYKEVIHVNGSARVQTVTQNINPTFYGLLKTFKQVSGSGILLNTSFNKKGMPIVETPYQALSLFYETKMDAVVIHDYVFTKNQQQVYFASASYKTP
ncbi:MAG TPA: carbamoyltransferase C-terminal domain-containing protein [Mucilaginibacter sp.]|nr:carbamoyltransferase C-terminal domain-containing protein [Mucilaginibacter sp.]